MATDVLRGALNTDVKSPVERFGGVLTGGSIKERGQAARQAMPTIMQESAQAASLAKRAELEATNQQLGREAGVEEEAATKLRAETERIRGLEQPYQEFKAPEYTALDYAKGAAKRALVGVLLGGIAKTSALTQLKAIKAMQDAEKEGRTQDFEAARLSFDEAEKKRVDFNQRLQTELSDFQQLLGKDTAAARLKAKMMTAQMMDGLASAAERNQNYKQFTEILTNATKQSDELEMEAFKQKGRLEEKRLEVGAKSAPDRRLKPGEQWNEEKGVIEAIPGSDLYKKQQAGFAKEYKSATSTIDQLESGLAKIGEILDPKNKDGFELNFGGYNAYGTRMLSGKASDMRTKIEAFKSEMKNAGLSLIRMGGSIGQITEREWPIVEQLIDAIDPVLSEGEARNRFEQIGARFQGIMNRAKDVYDTQFRDSQFYKPLSGMRQESPTPSPEPVQNIEQLRQQATEAIKNGASEQEVRKRFKQMTGKDL